MAVVTLLTDFGTSDYYVGIFKGDIYTACPSVKVVDISHSIPPYDISAGAFFLKNTFAHFPAGTIHIVRVYEQGVGKQRLLACKYKNHYFIAPDNGILSLAFGEKPDLIVEVDTNRIKLNTLEEYYCRVLREIIFNNNIGEIGFSIQSYEERIPLLPMVQEDRIIGKVMWVDHFGNAITNIHKDDVQRFGDRKMEINFRKSDKIDRIVKNYNDVPPSYSMGRFNALGYLELSIHCGNAADLLGLSSESAVQIIFE